MPEDFFGLSGHVIDGQFHAHAIAGEGGFSVVYRGQHLTLREPIAIKCLKLKLKTTDEQIVASFTQRFFDESRIMYRLSQGNLNIARAITTGVTVAPKTQAKVPYMVLEWLEGVSLAQELKERRAQKLAPPPLREVMTMFEPAALGIAYAHAQGVVHRDIKPGNLFLHNTREGRRMKVLDFGMAKVVQPDAMGGLESAETLAGVTVLSPQYVTPEQLDKSLGAIGPWTDVYAFALIVLEALTNRRAREAENFAQLMAQIARPTEVPTPRKRGANVSQAVDRVFERALARDPKARPPDLGAFWRELVNASVQPDLEALDALTTVDAPVAHAAMQSLGSTMVMPSAAASEAPKKTDLGKTMPLRVATLPAAAPRALSGTVPLEGVPEAPAARVAALEAARPSLAEPARSWAPPQPVAIPVAPPISSPRIVEAPPPAVSAPSRAAAPRSNRALVAFFVVFVVASIAASALLIASLYVHR